MVNMKVGFKVLNILSSQVLKTANNQNGHLTQNGDIFRWQIFAGVRLNDFTVIHCNSATYKDKGLMTLGLI